MASPYAPPSSPIDARPAAIGWYRAYAAGSAVVYLVLGIFVLVARGSPILAGVALSLAVFFAGAAMIRYTPRGWTIGLVAIALGLAGFGILFALPLAMQWNKPVLKAAFRRLP
jgi:hypothetical protein